MRSPRRKKEFILCRAALRAIVCHRLGCLNRDLSFDLSHYGKPFALENGVRAPVSFNISHSGLHGLIAVASAGHIGVDVEERRKRPDLAGTVRTIMSPHETRMLVGHPDGETDYHLYRVWTLKEALAKALGLGFSLDLTRVSLPSAMLDGKRIGELRLPHAPSVRWRIEDLGNPRYAAALALGLSPATATAA
jgi:4'-phosphopantetheinyl transferase